MSLFKVRDWWTTTCGPDEHFDQGCLCVANIDNQADGLDKVIVGSHEGILRIFNPHPVPQEDGSLGGFKPDDMLLESQLQQPILQLDTGLLTGVNDRISLAVLQPRKISVYGVSSTSGAVEHGTHYHLSLQYEHNLQRSAFCFVLGGFGSVKGQDFMCVQSLDGTLSFFEQESFAFSRFLPGFLLPGPLQYVPRTDCLVTASAAWNLEAYKYQVLAVATGSGTKEESQAMTTGKKVMADWSFTLGEGALDIQVIPQRNLIFVLGERNIFCLKDTGGLIFVKTPDYIPSCFLPYIVSDGPPFILAASQGRTLHVYQDTMLRWAAQLPFIPVAIRRANLPDLKGVLVLLSDTGELHCSYLGTNPALFVPPAVDAREINYAETDREMNELQKIIKASQKSNFLPHSKKVGTELSMEVTVAKTLEQTPIAARDGSDPEAEPVPSVSVKIQLRTMEILSDVRLIIDVTRPLVVTHGVFTFPSISDTMQVVVSIYTKEKFLPCYLSGRAVATYASNAGIPQVVVSNFTLPVRLVIRPVPPVKEARHKVTINTGRPAVSLYDLFPDVGGDDRTSSSQAMGFEFYAGPVVTLLAAKTSQRYRLQSEQYAALWLVTCELVQRLQQWFSRGSSSNKDVLVTYSSNIPVQEFFEVLDAHFQARLDMQRFQMLLGQRAAQFRSVQKRLLTKFKDKTPNSQENFDVLLEGTYRQILTMIEGAEENERHLAKCSCDLSCAASLTLLLLKLQTGMAEDEYQLLHALFYLPVEDRMDQGWEEVVDAGLTHLLRTTLAKAGKEQVPSPGPMAMAKDCTRLKKHVALIVDRLCKGGHLLEREGSSKQRRNSQAATEAPLPPTPALIECDDEIPDDLSGNQDDDDDLEDGMSHVPTGSQFGDRSTSARLRSARLLAKSQESPPVEETPAMAGVSEIPQDDVPEIVSTSQALDEDDEEDDILSF